MKTCSKCKTPKPKTEFYKDSNKKDGLRPSCKTCSAKTAKKSYWKHIDVRRERSKTYYSETKDRQLEYSRNWYKDNRERRIAKAKEWEKNNRKARKDIKERYKMSLLSSCPSWLSEEQKEEILKIYRLAGLLTEITDIRHEVDHVTPLQGKSVCGLHVSWNLQVIPKRENCKKRNKFDGGW